MIAPHAKISTPYFGLELIKWFGDNKPDERFLVYCWDFEAKDFTLGWAFNPTKSKIAKTIRVKLDNGISFAVTPEQQILTKDLKWVEAEKLKFGDNLLAFNKVKPNIHFNDELKTKQFPRIYTYTHGWKTERQFIDEWRNGDVDEADKHQYVINRLFAEGITAEEVARITDHEVVTLRTRLHKAGFSLKEMRNLGKQKQFRRVLGTEPWLELDVYDLSVEKYENFCGESIVFR
jgi:intein/homing endonuclease